MPHPIEVGHDVAELADGLVRVLTPVCVPRADPDPVRPQIPSHGGGLGRRTGTAVRPEGDVEGARRTPARPEVGSRGIVLHGIGGGRFVVVPEGALADPPRWADDRPAPKLSRPPRRTGSHRPGPSGIPGPSAGDARRSSRTHARWPGVWRVTPAGHASSLVREAEEGPTTARCAARVRPRRISLPAPRDSREALPAASILNPCRRF